MLHDHRRVELLSVCDLLHGVGDCVQFRRAGVDQLAPETLRSKVERLFLIHVVSYDWNCPQYITPRFTVAEVADYIAPLKARIAELEAQLGTRDGPWPEAIDGKEVQA